MAELVTVTEPITGVKLEVLPDSPQAKAWGKPVAPVGIPAEGAPVEGHPESTPRRTRGK